MMLETPRSVPERAVASMKRAAGTEPKIRKAGSSGLPPAFLLSKFKSGHGSRGQVRRFMVVAQGSHRT